MALALLGLASCGSPHPGAEQEPPNQLTCP
jgi:hypothetical protein